MADAPALVVLGSGWCAVAVVALLSWRRCSAESRDEQSSRPTFNSDMQ
jgi:hypothetical protein